MQDRSVRLDIKAKDRSGKLYNIEVQRADRGAGEKRARYYSAMLDANTLLPGEDFEQLPETYVIFITEHDVLKAGLPLYHIDRRIEENGMTFFDESHIIYVNGEYREENDIGKLMHDFSCTNPDEMKLGLLAEKTRYFKENDKGVNRMCKIMEDFAAEERKEEREAQAEEFAVSLLKDGTLSIAKIAEVSKLPAEKVRELAEKVKVSG